MAKTAEQMELFEPVERGFNEGGDMSSAKDAAMQDLESSAADKQAARKDQFDKLTDMLMSGEIKDMPEEKQQKFIKLYKMMKSQGFNEGGLMDEGGMVDEESGNEVPPGSLREEVRDDIPAQLSEGEFVFPADVVRYIGLENLMRMRQEAKQGLAQMEAMGQMGNSEEATVQDDLPFDMYDLDVEDDKLEMQTGGLVPASAQQPYGQPTQLNPQTGTYTLPGTGITGYQVPSGQQTGYTPYGGVAPVFVPTQFTGPQYQTALQTTNLPTFAETVGSKAGQYDELRTYQNDAGQTLQIPFKDGKPIYPVPEGYSPIGDKPAPEEETKVTPTVGTTTVRDEGGGDGGEPDPTPSGPLGGNVNTLESTAYSKAVATLSMNQLSTLSPVMSMISSLEGKPSANTLAALTNEARNVAVKSLGLEDISQATVSDLDAIGSAMNVTNNFSSIGQVQAAKATAQSVAKAVANAVSKGNMTTEQADALANMTQDEETGALKGKDGKTGKAMSIEDQNAITAYAQAMIDSDIAMQDDEDLGLTGPSFSDESLGKGSGREGQGPSRGDMGDTASVGGQPGTPGNPGMGGAAPGGAPGAAPDSGASSSGGMGTGGGPAGSRYKSGGLAKQMKHSGLASKK